MKTEMKGGGVSVEGPTTRPTPGIGGQAPVQGNGHDLPGEVVRPVEDAVVLDGLLGDLVARRGDRVKRSCLVAPVDDADEGVHEVLHVGDGGDGRGGCRFGTKTFADVVSSLRTGQPSQLGCGVSLEGGTVADEDDLGL